MFKKIISLTAAALLLVIFQKIVLADSVDSLHILHPSISSSLPDFQLVTMVSDPATKISVESHFAAFGLLQAADSLGYGGVTINYTLSSEFLNADAIMNSIFMNEPANNSANQIWNIGVIEGTNFASVTFGDGTSGTIYNSDMIEMAAAAVITGRTISKRSTCVWVWNQAANKIENRCGVITRLKLN